MDVDFLTRFWLSGRLEKLSDASTFALLLYREQKKLNVSLLIKQTNKETIVKPLTSMSDQDQDQDRNSPYNTATISSKGIQYQILRTNITRIVWQAVRRITTIMRLGSDRFRETRALDVKLNCIEIQSLFKEIKWLNQVSLLTAVVVASKLPETFLLNELKHVLAI